jgi:Ca2+-dependent lipid-binding protein
MDPFATVKYRQQDFKTKAKKGAGKTPIWDETFEIDVKYQGDDLVLKIFDEDVFISDLVGTATIKV